MKGGPTFLVAGAARAGSTAVVEALRAHPDVFVTQPKEPHYFAFAGRPVFFTGPGDETTINRALVWDLHRYLSLYPTDGRYVATGEGSVSTLYYAEKAIPAIRAVNPRMRIVLLLREPVARAFSSFQYLQGRGFEPLNDFLAAVDDEPRRRELGWHHLWHYTGMSYYSASVHQFLAAFGDQVQVWFHDQLLKDPVTTLAEIQLFLGVEPHRVSVAEAPRVNTSGEPRREAVQQAMQWASRSAVVRTTVKSAVPFALRERIRNANLRASGVSPEARATLLPRFAGDLQRLAEVLDRPLPDGWLS
jgi:hypothetical protein